MSNETVPAAGKVLKMFRDLTDVVVLHMKKRI
jgi:hypothetical protein